MKYTPHLKYAFLALLALLVLAGLAGHPIISFDVLAGAGMLPLAIGETDFGDITKMLQKQGEAFEEFKTRQDQRIKNLETEVIEEFKKRNRPLMGGDDYADSVDPKSTGWVDTKTGNPITVLSHGQRLVPAAKATSAPTVGRVLRGICLGGSAPDAGELMEERKAMGIDSDPSGGYTVSGSLASTWIDNLRAASVLSRAGCLTYPMDTGEVSIARVTGDPTCSWHAENAAIGDTEATFGKLNLKAKTIVCLVKFSLELGQDAVNLEVQLQNVIMKAMAGAIDGAGLNGVSVNAAAAPGGVMNLADRNSVTSIGAPTSWDFVVDGMYELMLDNVPAENIGALVAHPAVWKKMRKLKTGITNDNTPLTMPEEVAKLPKLWTTAAPLTGGTTAAGIVADWRDLIMGIRQQITVRVLSETFLGSNLQLAVLAYARVDFGAARAASFCTLEGITV